MTTTQTPTALSACCRETVSRPVAETGAWSCDNCHQVQLVAADNSHARAAGTEAAFRDYTNAELADDLSMRVYGRGAAQVAWEEGYRAEAARLTGKLPTARQRLMGYAVCATCGYVVEHSDLCPSR